MLATNTQFELVACFASTLGCDLDQLSHAIKIQ